MDIETWMAMNESLYLSLLRMIEFIMLLTTLIAILGFVIYLIGIAWLCCQETRPSTRQHRVCQPSPSRRTSRLQPAVQETLEI